MKLDGTGLATLANGLGVEALDGRLRYGCEALIIQDRARAARLLFDVLKIRDASKGDTESTLAKLAHELGPFGISQEQAVANRDSEAHGNWRLALCHAASQRAIQSAVTPRLAFPVAPAPAGPSPEASATPTPAPAVAAEPEPVGPATTSTAQPAPAGTADEPSAPSEPAATAATAVQATRAATGTKRSSSARRRQKKATPPSSGGVVSGTQPSEDSRFSSAQTSLSGGGVAGPTVSAASRQGVAGAGIPAGQIVEIQIDQIDLTRNEFEFRVDPKVDDLVEDMDRNGQQFAVVVRPIKGSRNYQLVCGFRRVRGRLKRGASTVLAIVRDDLDDDAAYRLSFTENQRRKSLTGVDKAHAIAKLRLVGKTTAEIKELYGIGDKQLERYEKVNSFPKALKDAISEQRILTTHGLLLAQAHSLHGDALDLKAWIDRVVEQALSVRQLGRALRTEFRPTKRRARYFERKKGGGFRLFAMTFDPATTDQPARGKMRETLTLALSILQPPTAKAGGKSANRGAADELGAEPGPKAEMHRAITRQPRHRP